MALRWDWLQPLITAPYVPTLGPVHPQAVTASLFADLIEVAGTSRLLPYDKDRRWADRKDEQVLSEAIIQAPGLTMIPTLRTTRDSCIRVYTYSRQPQGTLNQAAELGRRLCQQHDVGTGRITWFLPPGSDPAAACTRTQTRTFSPPQPATEAEAPAGVIPLDEASNAVRGTFSVFAEKLAADGFAFLDSRIRRGGTGPVLIVQRYNAVAGAIGPMEIMLLQTQVGGASDRLCRSEGLTDLGLVCTITLQR